MSLRTRGNWQSRAISGCFIGWETTVSISICAPTLCRTSPSNEACELRARFFAGYPDMARWQDEYARHTREQGYTQTVAGRRWRWKWQAQDPEDVDEDAPFYDDVISGFRGAYAINHPVQGSSAEVMQIALTRLDQALRNEPVQIIATVHDEAVLLVPDDIASVERIGAIAQQEMISAFLEVFPDAPTLNLVDPKVGPTWGDLQSLPDWLQNHRPTEFNVSSGESIGSVMVAV